MALALETGEEGEAAHEVDLILAHGTGTKANDVTESQAIQGDLRRPSAPRAVSVESMLGHTMGAASALAAIACALAITHRFIPRPSTTTAPTRSAVSIVCPTTPSRPICGSCRTTDSASGATTRSRSWAGTRSPCQRASRLADRTAPARWPPSAGPRRDLRRPVRGHVRAAPGLRGFDRSRYTPATACSRSTTAWAPGTSRAGLPAFLLDAIGQALADAGMGEQLGDTPVLVGTGLRELRSVELWAREGIPWSADRLHFGHALRERLRRDDDVHLLKCLFSLALRALDGLRPARPAEVPRPWSWRASMSSPRAWVGVADRLQSVAPTVRTVDRNRRGTILGEGASAVVLRRTREPGRPCLGRVRGVAVNCDAHHATAPHAGNIAAAVHDAHRRAGTGPKDVDLVMLHGTEPTPTTSPRRHACGVRNHPRETTLMTAMKSMTGHTSGASGLHSLIIALRAMADELRPRPDIDEQMDEVADWGVGARPHRRTWRWRRWALPVSAGSTPSRSWPVADVDADGRDRNRLAIAVLFVASDPDDGDPADGGGAEARSPVAQGLRHQDRATRTPPRRRDA